jgi:5-methylcytosine-specific restriction endonuclease McrA
MPKKRVYKKGVEGSEYKYGASEKAKKDRVDRNRARRHAIAAGKVQKGTADNKNTMEVDHKVPLSKGGSGDASNTRVVPRSVNRKKADKSPAKRTAKKK